MPKRLRHTILALALVMSSLAASAASEKYKIVNEGGIRDDWAAADGAKFRVPGYPAAFASRGDDVCLAMGYAIKADGTTGDFSIVKAWSSSGGEDEPAQGYWDAFSQAGASALSQWKFQPRAINAAVPTYTVATLFFQGKGQVPVDDLRGHCAISDLEVAFANMKADRFIGSGDKHEMDRQAQQAQRAIVNAAAAQAIGRNAR